MRIWSCRLIRLAGLIMFGLGRGSTILADDPSPPSAPVRLIFIHHSTGGHWLTDPSPDQPSGGLDCGLMQNNYFVSATNYGWGPDSIGDRTDIPNWMEGFAGPNRAAILNALYHESAQNFGDFDTWPRRLAPSIGENQIIRFKSCFPNSDLYGAPNDPPAAQPNDQFTGSNAKAVYTRLLTYFATRPDKLFVVITAPPLSRSETAPDRAANARAFNNWLVNDWGQRLTSLTVLGDALYAGTSNKGGTPRPPEYTFIDDAVLREYRQVHRLRLPGLCAGRRGG